MVMLAAYFDESGTHKGSPILAVAGYVSTVPKWKRFQREWMEALRTAKVDCFHMSEYENRKGIFADWSQRKRIAVIKRLTEIIKTNALHGVAAAVIVNDYKEIVGQAKGTFSPYTFCVVRCMVQIARWAKKSYQEGRIAYIFENGAGYGGEIEKKKMDLISNTLVKEAYRYQSLTFCNKRTLIPLQAADVIAYETMKHCKNHYLSDNKQDPRKSLQNLLSLPHDSEFFNKDGLLGYAQWVREMYETLDEHTRKAPSA